MPNWCWNDLTITHNDSSKIAALVAACDADSDSFFEHIKPMPPEVSTEDNVNWCLENWGTKWDVEIQDSDIHGDNTLHVAFESAWSPPLALYDYMTADGYEITALFFEDGQGFIGKYEHGEAQTFHIDFDDESSLDDIPTELIEFGDLRAYFEDDDDNDS